MCCVDDAPGLKAHLGRLNRLGTRHMFHVKPPSNGRRSYTLFPLPTTSFQCTWH